MDRVTNADSGASRTRSFLIGGKTYFGTHIPTKTAVVWIVIHDECGVFGVVLMDLRGQVVRWLNPPEGHREPVEEAIRQAFGLGSD